MDRLKQIETFVAVAQRGSLSAAAHAEGIAPAVVSRRLDALETRLGVKLLVRTTRKVSLTSEGGAYLEDCQRILRELADTEASVSQGSLHASGHLKLGAPAGFGRIHVAPLLRSFLAEHPDITADLDLSDRTVDLVKEGYDCTVRLGMLADSNIVAVRLCEMPRVVVGSPAYFQQRGIPRDLRDLASHECLMLANQSGWDFTTNGDSVRFKPHGRFLCNDGAVLHEWALAGMGLAWRSLWEVGADLRRGQLVTVLDAFAAPPVGIHAVFPQRRHLPLRVRLFLDWLKENYNSPRYWDKDA